MDGTPNRDRLAEILAGVFGAIPEGIDRILVVPDGALATVSMAGIPAPRGGTLIDHLAVSYLDASHDLLETGTAAASSALEVVISDPAYDIGDDGPPTAAQVFAPLPGTRLEAQAVERMLGAVHWTGTEVESHEFSAFERRACCTSPPTDTSWTATPPPSGRWTTAWPSP